MNSQELVNHVYEKTHIRIEETDPVFAVVALNEQLLRQLIQEQIDQLAQRVQELSSRHEQWMQHQAQWLDQTDDTMATAIADATDAAKNDICTTGAATAISVVKDTVTQQIQSALDRMDDTARRLDKSLTEAAVQMKSQVDNASQQFEQCVKAASLHIRNITPPPSYSLFQRCVLMAAAATAGSVISLYSFFWLIKSNTIALYEPAKLTAEEVAKEISKHLPRRK